MSIADVPALKHRTKAEVAYAFIREAILNGTFKPGSRLIAKNLAAHLEMSEIPVREALQRLNHDGLVSWAPHVGSSVSNLRVDELAEILLIRSELEALATKVAAEHMTIEMERELEEQIAAMESVIAAGAVEQYGALNRKFHLTIYSVIPLPRLRGLIEDLFDQAPRARAVFLINNERVRASNAEHKELLEALRVRDGDRAAQIVRQQKLKAREAFLGPDHPRVVPRSESGGPDQPQEEDLS